MVHYIKHQKKIKTKGRGKGKFLYAYTLIHGFKQYFDLWMTERESLGISSEWLFVSCRDGQYVQMSVESLNGYAETYSKMLEKDFYWHSLRHYFTTHLSKMSIPDSIIQEIIGWESSDMVKIYKDLSTDDQLGKYFDENGIKQIGNATLSDL